jgi:predicted HicB family RNase H-like nuclease
MGNVRRDTRRGDRHLMPQTAVRLPEDMVVAAKVRAAMEGKSLRALVEEAIADKLRERIAPRVRRTA